MRVSGLKRIEGPFLERLAATVAARSVLHKVVALAEEAPQISDDALRARLITMLPRLWPSTPALPGDPGPGH